MNDTGSRRSLMTAILLGLLVTGAGASYFHSRASRLRAADAIRNVQPCRELATRIKQLQAGPQRADLQSRSETELSRKRSVCNAVHHTHHRNVLTELDRAFLIESITCLIKLPCLRVRQHTIV